MNEWTSHCKLKREKVSADVYFLFFFFLSLLRQVRLGDEVRIRLTCVYGNQVRVARVQDDGDEEEEQVKTPGNRERKRKEARERKSVKIDRHSHLITRLKGGTFKCIMSGETCNLGPHPRWWGGVTGTQGKRGKKRQRGDKTNSKREKKKEEEENTWSCWFVAPSTTSTWTKGAQAILAGNTSKCIII